MKLIDLMIELLDARIPCSSRNPDIDLLAKNKLRLIVLNKADLADEAVTKQWAAYFQEKKIRTVVLDSRSRNGMKTVQEAIADVCKEKTERDRKRGIQNRPVRAMVAGIPNVGKSTFINSFAGRACAKTGNKPGVTKGKQWIRLHKNVELLDTPGILWPKFDDETVGIHLALIGSVNDRILDTQELAAAALRVLTERYQEEVRRRYPVFCGQDCYELLCAIALLRGCLKKGGEPDCAKAALLILDDFRSGRLGRVTLEYPKAEE